MNILSTSSVTTFMQRNGNTIPVSIWHASIYESMYSRIDQVQFVEDRLKKIEVIWSAQVDHVSSDFSKAVFQNFYLVHSWTKWPIHTLRWASFYLCAKLIIPWRTKQPRSLSPSLSLSADREILSSCIYGEKYSRVARKNLRKTDF